MKTTREVEEWAGQAVARALQDNGKSHPDDSATAARIARALRVLESFEKWEGVCNTVADLEQSLRAAMAEPGSEK